MRKFLVPLGLIALGGLVMYLMAPDRGRPRWTRLADQAGAKSKDIADSVSTAAHRQANVVKDVAHDVADAFTADAEGSGEKKRSGGTK